MLASLNEDLADATSSLDRSIEAVNLLNVKSTKLTKWTMDKTKDLIIVEEKSGDDCLSKFNILEFCQVYIYLYIYVLFI